MWYYFEYLKTYTNSILLYSFYVFALFLCLIGLLGLSHVDICRPS